MKPHSGAAAIALMSVLGAAVRAQEAAAPAPNATELLARFHALPADRQAAVVRDLEKRLLREGDDTIQRIVSRKKGRSAYPVAPAPKWFAPADYAPVAAPRSVVMPENAVHREFTKGMAATVPVPGLRCGVVFDWATGTAVRGERDLDDDQVFTNLVNGWVPGSDEAVAQVLATLHTDPTQGRRADWFGHLYADRDGRVFAGVTLFDAWASSGTIEMPDTDAIAFAREVLGTRSFVAPLPANRRRERLYQKMRDAFVDHREYRTMRMALAATFVTVDPTIDAGLQSLLPRCHWLWATAGDDPRSLANRLTQAKDRAGLLAEVDAAMKEDSTAGSRREQDLADLAVWLRRLADSEINRSRG